MVSLPAKAVGVAASSIGIVAAGAAIAMAGTSGSLNLHTTGVHFYGSYEFYAQGTNHGGMGYPGDICDTQADGNAVFVQAKVEGYGYGGRVYDHNGNGSCKWENYYVYDPAAAYVTGGKVQACQDRGTLFSDLCHASGWLYR